MALRHVVRRSCTRPQYPTQDARAEMRALPVLLLEMNAVAHCMFDYGAGAEPEA